MKMYWVIVNAITGVPVPPQDNNPCGRSEGMLVYPEIQSAEAACVYQKEAFEVDCKPVPLGNEKE